MEDEEFFPFPEFLVFIGYTFILIIDKVMFDTHALFEEDHEEHVDEEDGVENKFNDPADRQLIRTVRSSFRESRAQSYHSMRAMSIADGDDISP